MPTRDRQFMKLALRLARRGVGRTSPNPMVGAVLVKGTEIIGQGWHRRAGLPHAEVEAISDAVREGHATKGATLYVTLEPCCTHGQTPPCTEAIRAARIKRVVVGATDPNPRHRGRAFRVLRRAGIAVEAGVLDEECTQLNEAFNHWIVHRTPMITVKAAMTLDGKIATKTGESKWITGDRARAFGMKLRKGSDAILVGINTVLADDPALTRRSQIADCRLQNRKGLRRIVLDSMARTPLTAKVLSDECASWTTIVVSSRAPAKRVERLKNHVTVLTSPNPKSSIEHPASSIDLSWLLRRLGRDGVTSLLIEGGGEVNASFLLEAHVQRVAFFYAPKILGGRDSRKAVAGEGVGRLEDALRLEDIRWRKLGADLLLTARVRS
jgi:diaminohydroxyphosphoribosylaminopyrimidine deaminase/5-amino-6-(5-phosphoribosylamino)uracil reductase